MKRFVVRPGAPLALLVALALPACTADGGTSADLENLDATVFLAQKSPPGAVMDALYEGTVYRDHAGCLRAESDGAPVVIWPHGFRLAARGGALYVEDAEGRTLGTIGGDFRMGGGLVPAGHAETFLSDADRARAAICPTSSYWIAGSID